MDKFIELVHRYTDFTELTTPMIHECVDKIVVHEADKSTGDRIRQIDIYLKYVGRLDVPMPELTPEQIKEEDRKRVAGNFFRPALSYLIEAGETTEDAEDVVSELC